MRLKTTIRLGETLGKLLSSTNNGSDKKIVSKWFRSSNNASDLVRSVLDAEKIAQRRRLYGQCDVDEAWRHVEASVKRDNQRRRMLLRPYIIASCSAVAAVVAVACFVFLDNVNTNQREQTMNRIALLHPDGSKAVLHRADGTLIELNPSDSSRTVDGVDIIDNEITYNQKTKTSREMFDELVTPRGGEFRLTLPDGSKVWLNADSRLRYFSNNTGVVRKVFLTGEAYFEVAHDANRPFIVESAGQQINVLGTKFNVNAYPDQPLVETTLVDGSVRLSTLVGVDSVLLSAGQQSVYRTDNASPFDVKHVDTDKYTSWRTGEFVFDHASLKEIMTRLSRWYVFDFEIADRLSGLYFSGDFPRYENLDKVLEIITSTGTDIDIHLRDKTIILE